MAAPGPADLQATVGDPSKVAHDAASVPNRDAVISRLADHPRLRHVVRNFAMQLPAKLQGMHDALGRTELNELAALAHWLKGAGGTVGYDELFEPARDLEAHARSGDVGAIADALRTLQSLVQRMVIPDATSAPAVSAERTPVTV